MARKITLYEGPIHKIFADGIHLKKEQVIPMERRLIIKEQALYYPFLGNLINLEYDELLPTEEEATNYMNQVIKKRKKMIIDFFTNPKYSSEDQQNLLSFLSSITSCIYYNPEEVKPLTEISKKELKVLKKEMKRKKEISE